MEGRRLSIHAGAPRRQEVKLGLAALLAIVLASPLAGAVPKDGKARAAFDQGIAAYQKSDWAAAAEAFAKSYAIEADVETLFAWAQAERQQDHCDKAIELYNKLLEGKLPEENKQVVTEKLGECKKIVAARTPEPLPETQPSEPEARPLPEVRPPDKGPEGKSRWKDPLGGVLVGTGVVGLAVGGYFLSVAKGADSDAKALAKMGGTYSEVEDLNDKAESKGRIGVIAAIAGGALIVGGVVRYATRSTKTTTVTGWLAPDGGGIAALGRF